MVYEHAVQDNISQNRKNVRPRIGIHTKKRNRFIETEIASGFGLIKRRPHIFVETVCSNNAALSNTCCLCRSWIFRRIDLLSSREPGVHDWCFVLPLHLDTTRKWSPWVSTISMLFSEPTVWHLKTCLMVLFYHCNLWIRALQFLWWLSFPFDWEHGYSIDDDYGWRNISCRTKQCQQRYWQPKLEANRNISNRHLRSNW